MEAPAFRLDPDRTRNTQLILSFTLLLLLQVSIATHFSGLAAWLVPDLRILDRSALPAAVYLLMLLSMANGVWNYRSRTLCRQRRVGTLILDILLLITGLYYAQHLAIYAFVIILVVSVLYAAMYGLRYMFYAQGLSATLLLALKSQAGLAHPDSELWFLYASSGFSILLLPLGVVVIANWLRRDIHDVQRASEAKSQFLTRMSHELRTPLHGVIGLNEQLLKTPVNQNQRSIISDVNQSAKALLGLIQRILDISQIESGKISLRYQLTNLRMLMQDVIAMQSSLAKRKNISLSAEMDFSSFYHARIDNKLVFQVLTNLTMNAIKFTDEGRVTLTCRSLYRDDHQNWLQFSVADTGVGIKQEDQDKLFEEFYQVQGYGNLSEQNGAGLGTTICKELVTMMGGKITVSSVVGVGSTFSFMIPCRPFRPGESPAPNLTTERITVLARNNEEGQDIIQRAGLSPEKSRIFYDEQGEGRLIKPWREAELLVVDERALSEQALISLEDFYKKNTRPGQDAGQQGYILLSHKRYGREDEAFHGYGAVLEYAGLNHERFNNAAQAVVDYQEKHARQQDPIQPGSLPGELNILVAEDNKTNLRVLEYILDVMSSSIVMANDGDEAALIYDAEPEHFDLIIVDKNMPGKTGVEVVSHIRQNKIKSDTPIIMLTADATEESRQGSLSAGADIFLTKPVLENQLLHAIHTLCKDKLRDHSAIPASEQEGFLPEEQEMSGMDELATGLLDQAKVNQLKAMGQGKFFPKIYAGFKRDAIKQINQMKVSQNVDLNKTYDAAHTLKGASREMGANQLAHACIRMESMARDGGEEDFIDRLEEVEQSYRSTLKALDEITTELESYYEA